MRRLTPQQHAHLRKYVASTHRTEGHHALADAIAVLLEDYQDLLSLVNAAEGVDTGWYGVDVPDLPIPWR